ncbi:MutS protein 1 [Neofusicoccum ribis]|uniref:MutS protein 1 n=1 Tax=Neofusicoccum ribis TaxID=45134 RepID=A0ABR3TBI1_9PEZI
MRKFDHCVLLTRVGNFYELYFEHAEEYGPLLSLKVSQRRSRPGLGPVPMAGFPYFQLDRFLKILVQDLNKYVAISEEYRNDASAKLKSGGLLFDRKVSRIVTPGTLIDEKFIDPWENNYCLSIHFQPTEGSGDGLGVGGDKSPELGLAWLDISSGEFFTQSMTLAGLSSALALIGPREVILDSTLEEQGDPKLVNTLKEDRHVISFHEPEPGSNVPDDYARLVEEAVPGCNTSAFPLPELGAAAFLLGYVRTQLQGSSVALQLPVRRQADEFMSIDKNTLRALELRTTLREGKLEGSLLHSVRKTVTKSGTRLLTQRLSKNPNVTCPSSRADVEKASPSMSLDIINERLDLVAGLIKNVALRQNLIALLRRTFDTWRLVQKFSVGRGDADDLLELSKTIQISQDVAQLLGNETGSGASFDGLVHRLSLASPARLAARILKTIDEEGLSEQHRMEDDEAAAMAGLAVEVLTEEGEEVKSGRLAKRAKAKPNGKLGASKAVETGMPDVWIMRPNLDSARSVSSSKSTRSYHVPAWTRLGNQMDEAKLRIRSEEQRIFGELRAEVVRNLVKLRRNAAVLDELDVACSFATLAEGRGLVGSADNLYQDQSTFMVEMLETAEILKQATPRSFVIMDEVGRGTTPEDGIAVGYACLHHLYHANRCRALFATHFHRLADMTKDWEKLGCYCTDVEEGTDGTFAYVHRLRKGINRKSHALKVARVAGLPDEAISVAARVLEDFEMSPTS